MQGTQFHSTDVTLWRTNVTPGHDNISQFKLHDFRFSAQVGKYPKGGKHIITYAEFRLSPKYSHEFVIAMATEMLNIAKDVNHHLLRSFKGDTAETLQKCSTH